MNSLTRQLPYRDCQSRNLVDIEEQAQERFERIVEQMKQAQGITERLKADNAWEWVGRMNNIQACAREIVDKEIIYQ